MYAREEKKNICKLFLFAHRSGNALSCRGAAKIVVRELDIAPYYLLSVDLLLNAPVRQPQKAGVLQVASNIRHYINGAAPARPGMPFARPRWYYYSNAIGARPQIARTFGLALSS